MFPRTFSGYDRDAGLTVRRPNAVMLKRSEASPREAHVGAADALVPIVTITSAARTGFARGAFPTVRMTRMGASNARVQGRLRKVAPLLVIQAAASERSEEPVL